MEKCNWEEYCDKLSEAFKKGKYQELDNNNKECDAAVNKSMLDHCNSISMFSRKMSVFSDSFYQDNKELESRKDEVKNSLQQFFKKEESRMLVIVTEKPEAKDFLLGDEMLKRLVNECKIWIYRIPKDIARGIPHFTTADKSAVRIENNDEEKSGTCVFYDENLTANLNNSFSTFKAYSTLISY